MSSFAEQQAMSAAVSASAPKTPSEAPQQISLRVMRLSRPTLPSLADTLPPQDFDSLSIHPPDPLGDSQSGGALHAGDTQLALPTSFGAIYLGESFPAYLSLTNDSARESARDVVVKAELQTSTQRFVLIDTTDHPTPAMPPQALTEYLIKHEVKELGVHVLVCSVQYTAKQLGAGGQTRDERRSFRKFYKFQVLNPLAVKTKVNSRLDSRVFLEVQVQNITQDPMCLEKLVLDPAGPFQVRDLNIRLGEEERKVDRVREGEGSRRTSRSLSQRLSLQSEKRTSTTPSIPVKTLPPPSISSSDEDSDESSEEEEEEEEKEKKKKKKSPRPTGPTITPEDSGSSSQMAREPSKEPIISPGMAKELSLPRPKHIFGDTDFLLPGDVRQYLYLLYPRDDAHVAAALTSNALGKLDIVWRFSFGETGRLQTSQLTRRIPVADAIQVITRHVEPHIQVERPFTVHLRIANRTDASMKLQLSAVKAKMGAVLMRGQASRALGEVAPQGEVDCSIEFLPLAPGLHAVSGVRVSDYISGESRDIEVAEVFVTMGGPSEEEDSVDFSPLPPASSQAASTAVP